MHNVTISSSILIIKLEEISIYKKAQNLRLKIKHLQKYIFVLGFAFDCHCMEWKSKEFMAPSLSHWFLPWLASYKTVTILKWPSRFGVQRVENTHTTPTELRYRCRWHKRLGSFAPGRLTALRKSWGMALNHRNSFCRNGGGGGCGFGSCFCRDGAES